MPNYLLHQTAAGEPIGVYTATSDYYVPKFEHLRSEGRQVVYSKLPSAEWGDFIQRLAGTQPSRTMRWDTYNDTSLNLSLVLEHARRDTVEEGQPEPE
jgi:hypothetical protein